MCVSKGGWNIEVNVCFKRWLVYRGQCVFQKVGTYKEVYVCFQRRLVCGGSSVM